MLLNNQHGQKYRAFCGSYICELPSGLYLWAPMAKPMKSSYCKVAWPCIFLSRARKESVKQNFFKIFFGPSNVDDHIWTEWKLTISIAQKKNNKRAFLMLQLGFKGIVTDIKNMMELKGDI